ncbi:protein BatD [Sesbania bispinosa]|nr:protein BatD [Sesbania bispinosa]
MFRFQSQRRDHPQVQPSMAESSRTSQTPSLPASARAGDSDIPGDSCTSLLGFPITAARTHPSIVAAARSNPSTVVLAQIRRASLQSTSE